MINAFALHSIAQNVSNVTAMQNGEQIIVSYKIDGGDADKVYTPTLYYSNDSGANYIKCISTKADYGKPNQTNQITWAVTNDLDYFGGENILFKVSVYGFFNFVKGVAIISGRKYKTIKIGSVEWMVENLNLDVGTSCWCYNDKPSNCDKYGRLYNLEDAKRAANKCTGWFLPTKLYFEVLDEFIKESNVSSQIKTSSMNVQNGGRNEVKNSYSKGGVFTWLNDLNFFWSSTTDGNMKALVYTLSESGRISSSSYEYNFNGCSVRLFRLAQ